MKQQIVVAQVDGCRYGFFAEDVREVLRLPTAVQLPKAPDVIEGIANIRGRVVPIFDLRRRFHRNRKPPHPSDHLIVAELGERVVAVRVDRAEGLATIDTREISEAGSITRHSEYLVGVATLPDGMVLIHDLRTFLDDSEARALSDALAQGAPAAS